MIISILEFFKDISNEYSIFLVDFIISIVGSIIGAGVLIIFLLIFNFLIIN